MSESSQGWRRVPCSLPRRDVARGGDQRRRVGWRGQEGWGWIDSSMFPLRCNAPGGAVPRVHEGGGVGVAHARAAAAAAARAESVGHPSNARTSSCRFSGASACRSSKVQHSQRQRTGHLGRPSSIPARAESVGHPASIPARDQSAGPARTDKRWLSAFSFERGVAAPDGREGLCFKGEGTIADGPGGVEQVIPDVSREPTRAGLRGAAPSIRGNAAAENPSVIGRAANEEGGAVCVIASSGCSDAAQHQLRKHHHPSQVAQISKEKIFSFLKNLAMECTTQHNLHQEQ